MSWFENLVTKQLWEVTSYDLAERLRSNPEYKEVDPVLPSEPEPPKQRKRK